MKEIRHHTEQQVRDVLAEALAAVQDLEVSGALEVAAFQEAVKLVSGKQIFYHPSDQQEPVQRAMAIPGKVRHHA